MLVYLGGGVFGFDVATSINGIYTVGDDRKSSTTINANKTAFEFFEVDFDVTAMNDEAFELAA